VWGSAAIASPDRLALGAIVACLAVELALTPIGLDVVDEGYFANQAVRVVHGEVPYRDFDTLYTPGLLYLNAGLFALFGGPHIIALRLLAWAGRVALAVSLYVLARPLARPFWAAVPALFVLLGLDTAPMFWWPHPGWLSAAGTAIVVRSLARLPALSESRRPRWLFFVGASIGLVFAFKQNAGVFLGMGAAVFLLLQGADAPRRPVSRPLRLTQAVGVCATIAALFWLVRPHLDIEVGAYLVAPVVAVCCLSLNNPVCSGGEPLRARLTFLASMALGFACVTIPWVFALGIALDGRLDRLGGFVGSVEQAGLFAPMHLPNSTDLAAVLAFTLAAVAALRIVADRRWPIAIAAGCSTLILVGFTTGFDQSLVRGLVGRPWQLGSGLPTLLPSFAFWAGLWVARRPILRTSEWQLRWYLTAGAFAFLTEYPINDLAHLAWSAGVLLVVGCIVLDRLHNWLAVRWRLTTASRVLLLVTLLLVPAFAALSVLSWRLHGVLRRDAITGLVRLHNFERSDSVPALDGLWVPSEQVQEVAELRNTLQSTTLPDEPIFVYPTAPLIYVVAERPNPTRYEHLYPGTVPTTELIRVVDSLQESGVRTVVVSSHSLLNGQAVAGGGIVDDYLRTHFREVWRSGEYGILQRVRNL
jgi:hypothetical protein